MKNVLEIMEMSTAYLQQRGIKSSRKEAAALIAWCLKIKPLDLYMQFDRPVDEAELESCRSSLRRRGKGEPFQYISGQVAFFGASIELSRDVLIPRQETEILVDLVAKEIAAEVSANASPVNASPVNASKVLWDLCCGSGCIGISLKKAFPSLSVVLSDCSKEALSVAERNAKGNNVDIELILADFTDAFAGRRVDYLICNPPYVSEEEFEHLDIEVRAFEPKGALVAKDQGLEFYRRLAQGIPGIMRPGGKIWLEIGHAQGAAVREIFAPVAAKMMELRQDWSGLDRFFLLELQ